MSKMVCAHCGSENVVADAWAEWSGKEWVLSTVFDYRHCNDCDGKTTVNEVQEGEDGNNDKRTSKVG